MWIDYDVQRTTRRCAVTDRPLLPGEEFYSVLAPPEAAPDGDEVERRDLSKDAWQGPPEGAIGWWRSRLPDGKSGKAKLAPNEVLLDLFDRWADEPSRVEARYVLALLLVRRRVLRLAETAAGNAESQAADSLQLYSPDRDAVYEVAVAAPDEARSQAIQSELFDLLYAEGQ